MLSESFANYVISITNKVVEDFLGSQWGQIQKEIKAMIAETIGDDYAITDPHTFDRISYCQYKIIGKHIADPKEMNFSFTTEVGSRIYDFARKDYKVDYINDPDDIYRVKLLLSEIGRFFREVGYVSHSEIRWDIFDETEWKTIGRSRFIYKMVDPVILPSAQQLFKEEGFAQHFSSRTIEHALKLSKIEGREVEDFDPSEYEMDDVAELWEIKKMHER